VDNGRQAKGFADAAYRDRSHSFLSLPT